MGTGGVYVSDGPSHLLRQPSLAHQLHMHSPRIITSDNLAIIGSYTKYTSRNQHITTRN
jgi:hypothetical protein